MTRIVGGKILGMLTGYKWELEGECFYTVLAPWHPSSPAVGVPVHSQISRKDKAVSQFRPHLRQTSSRDLRAHSIEYTQPWSLEHGSLGSEHSIRAVLNVRHWH